MKRLVLFLTLSLCACSSGPKPEAEWEDCSDIARGGRVESAIRVLGPQDAKMPGNDQEIYFWNSGDAIRTRDGVVLGTVCAAENQPPAWDKVGEGTTLGELYYWVGKSNNFEPVDGGKLYHYQMGYTTCTVGVSTKTETVIMRKCATDHAAAAANKSNELMFLNMLNQQTAHQEEMQLKRQQMVNDAYQAPSLVQPAKPTNCTTRYVGGTAYTNCY